MAKPAAGGRMIARHDGQILLVAGTIPGERVSVRIERVEKRLAFASALVRGACDLGTRRITPSQASSIVFSRPMAFEKWAFLTLDHERNVYAGVDSLRQLRAPRVDLRDDEPVAGVLRFELDLIADSELEPTKLDPAADGAVIR